jgi:hypothetical protein
LDSGRNTRASGECEPKKMEFEFSPECTNVFGFGAKLKE